MPTIITHGFVGWVFGKSSHRKKNWLFWLLILLCAVLPDADAIAFQWGVPYESMFGHRGITHSIFFACCVSLAVMLIAYPKIPRYGKSWWLLLLVFFGAAISHSVLDAMTSGGYGVAFFAPFSSKRYFFPWRPIKVSPISISRFFVTGYKVLLSEFLCVWVPCILFLMIRKK